MKCVFLQLKQKLLLDVFPEVLNIEVNKYYYYYMCLIGEPRILLAYLSAFRKLSRQADLQCMGASS